ncbi:hypothetical protein HBH92_078380 [Parastagonospora nodorum]|nr:hypothetical protein HBH49_059160 [Parastagonospora nodorum]KAH4130317.1 hypothetical protein HBH47_025730 [Parastagonospora nodorum]KAH4415487.1 hypothetical protein HBH92_078380 [Parastagonospora nodorum]KAH4440702.1 hypothetical protein HBH93_082910 [Parastagonospora nodorum]KAH4451697.1 hypothetical protein HBH91_111140 [Parastagonospora nodorum]
MEPVVSSAPFMPPIHAMKQGQIYLFGDLTGPFEDDLRQLLHCKSNALLQSFFDQVNYAYRQEFALLPAEQQEWLPRFTDLVDLVSNFEGSVGARALRFGLLCVYQLGRFILSNSYTPEFNPYIIGVCTGSFAAAAVSSSRTMAELVPAGVEAALAAFRTGLHSLKMQRDIEPAATEDAQSWSFIASMTESEALENIGAFISKDNPTKSQRPYISAVSPSKGVTISGPPRTLARFVKCCGIKAHTIPILSPYHANHLYGPDDIDEVLGCLRDDQLSTYRQRTPFLSIATGAEVIASDLIGLLRHAVTTTLCEQVRWDRLCTALKSSLAQHPSLESCVVFPVTSNAASLLASALRNELQLTVEVSDSMNSKVERTHTSPAPGKFQDSKIAIVGFSGRFPEAASNDELWQVLKAARDCHRTIPEDRFDWEAHFDPTGKKKNHSRVKYGCFINEPGVFDTAFFNISPREAENTDPAQRLALMAAYEAIEMAGFVPDRTASTQRDRVGVFFGTTSDDWREVNSGQNIDTYFIPGGNRAFVPGRINYFFRFSGPSISVDTACSSSFAAISTACNYLWQGDCDSAITGGTNVITNPDNFVGLDRGHFLSATGNCNPFDDSASGYCRADAVGVVVLKRLEDAIADRDPIFGVIAGSSTNHCGQTVSITRPHEGDQLSLFKRILRHTNTDPLDVSYVEMHGTGTQAGDAAEMRSVLSAFAWDHKRSKMSPSRPLHLGAIKANVGHAESASGVTALIKVLMMMKHSEIPPHRLDGKLNHNYPVDMAERNVHIPFKATPWRRSDCASGKRMAFLNNFSAAGGNTALLLEDAPDHQDVACTRPDARSVLPVAVTARTPQSLTDNIRALIDHLDAHPDTSLSSLSYTTTARRAHYKFRVLVSGADVAAIKAALQRCLDPSAPVKAVKAIPPKVAYAFTGQGTLYPGIAKELFEHVASFRDDLVRFDRIARCHGFPSFLPLITGEEQHVDAKTSDPVASHLAITCVQMALTHMWKALAGEPSCVIGHSLGEYAALYTARVLSASDTIFLVGGRAQLLVKHCSKGTHAMLAVKAPTDIIASDVDASGCVVACINSPVSTTVSGPTEAIAHLATSLKEKGLEAVLLQLPYAFHSTQVEPILSEFENLANCISFDEPVVPYMSPLLARTVTGPGILNASYLAQATRRCVDFRGAIDAAQESKLVDGSTIWLELGTHPACSGMLRQTIGTHVVTATTLRKDGQTWKTLVAALDAMYRTGIDLRWDVFHRGFDAAQKVLALPSYKWSLRRYWIQYRHNFCLTKGDDPAGLVPQTDAISGPPVNVPSLSSSVHRVVEETTSTEKASLLTESNLHDPRLLPIVSGHKVNTAMLCPSSLYADMALTIGKHMLRSNGTFQEQTGLDCRTMNVKNPLIVQPDATTQLLRVLAEADWHKKEISLKFFSVDANARKLADHASCLVKVTDKQSWVGEWKRNAYLVSSRIETLRKAVDAGSAHKLKRGLAYKLFASLVDYSSAYQGMEQVILDSERLEATALVKFQVDDGGFDWNPCWIDSLGHIAGFIMNGNDNIYSKDQVFINHGWDAMRCGKAVEHGKTYTTYNRMQLESGTMYVGDTYVFDGDEVIALFEGVKFQGVNRSVLDHLLPGKRTAKGAKAVAIPVQNKQSGKNASPKPAKQHHTPRPTVTAIPSKPSSGKIAKIMKILQDEAQMSEDELDLDAEFTDLGVDSLLSLTIVSRLRDELDIELPASAFVEHSTVRSFIAFASGDESAVSSSISSGASTPVLAGLKDEETYLTDATSVDGDSDDSDTNIMLLIRKIISEETGTALEEISTTASLAEFGLDSLLGLTIMSRLSEQIDATLPTSLFVENDTLGEVEAVLREAGLIKPEKQSQKVERMNRSSSGSRIDAKPVSGFPHFSAARVAPHASSLLLQGSSKRAKRNLFLFPDGAGSASSYHALADISPDVAVYGLNCPWLKNPQDLKCSLEEYVTKFLVEIQRRQPSGPYHFGGVSAGGILAYEAAQQLARIGEKVDTLLLLDTPDPVGLENPNQRMYDFLDSLGMFGMSGKAPTWLRPHFDAFLALLDAYDVKKFQGSSVPQIHIIYARDGMCKHESDPRPELRPDDPREMLWLLNNRTDFSGAGWNSLVGKENLHISVLDDVNHYTIMQPGPSMQELSARIARALESS